MKQYRIIKEGSMYLVQKRFWFIFWSEFYIRPNVIRYFAIVEDARIFVKERKQKKKQKKFVEYL